MDKITGVSIKALKGRKILTPFLGLISALPPWRRGIQGDWFPASKQALTLSGLATLTGLRM